MVVVCVKNNNNNQRFKPTTKKKPAEYFIQTRFRIDCCSISNYFFFVWIQEKKWYKIVVADVNCLLLMMMMMIVSQYSFLFLNLVLLILSYFIRFSFLHFFLASTTLLSLSLSSSLLCMIIIHNNTNSIVGYSGVLVLDSGLNSCTEYSKTTNEQGKTTYERRTKWNEQKKTTIRLDIYFFFVQQFYLFCLCFCSIWLFYYHHFKIEFKNSIWILFFV